MSAQTLTARLRSLDFSDWVGAVFFMACATVIFTRASQFSILLLPVFAHQVLASSSFLLWRTAPKKQSIKWYARAAAYGATFAVPVLVTLVQMWRPRWLVPIPHLQLTPVGGCLWIYGSVFGLWSLWYLRRSFSIEPEARELRTSGPYKIARHPIYAAFILQYTGILLVRLSVTLSLIYVFWFALMFVRARFEEQVLESAFPAYAAYRQQVGMFGPRFLRLLSKPDERPTLADGSPTTSGPNTVATAGSQTGESPNLSGRSITPLMPEST